MKPGWGAALLTTATLLRASPAPAAEALSSGLARCVSIASAETRLACYDALAGRSASQPAAAIAPTPAQPATPARSTSAGAAPAAAPVAAAPALLPAPVPGPDPAEAARNFGLGSAPAQGPNSIEAHVSQVTADRNLRSYAVLDNGQTWLSTEGGLDLNTGELVTIKKAALGSFMLVSTVSKHSYHVRRVR